MKAVSETFWILESVMRFPKTLPKALLPASHSVTLRRLYDSCDRRGSLAGEFDFFKRADYADKVGTDSGGGR